MAENKTSILICFAGRNRRIEISKKIAKIHGNGFTYKAIHKEDGATYLIDIKSENGKTANVVIYNKSGRHIIAERNNVAVRFHKYLYV